MCVCVCVFLHMCVVRFDVDFTEVHSYMTRGEAILQSPEFSVSRKDGSIQDLHDKVQVTKTLHLPFKGHTHTHTHGASSASTCAAHHTEISLISPVAVLHPRMTFPGVKCSSVEFSDL